jgi:hypothetical protein
MRSSAQSGDLRSPDPNYSDTYSISLLMSALCRELHVQFKAHESSNTAPPTINEITKEIKSDSKITILSPPK